MKLNLNIKEINKKIEIKLLDLLWLIIIPIININYLITNILTKTGHNLTTLIDNKIKFNSIFIIPYVYWYIYVIGGFIIILTQSRQNYMRVFLSLFLGLCICYIIYYLYPTEIMRPVVENNNIFNRLVNIIYLLDKPVNCFPSLHVLTTYFLMRYTKYKYSKKVFYYTQIIGVLIIISTLYIKQHFLLDILGAIILCEVIMLFIKRIESKKIDRILDVPYKVKESIVIYIKNNKVYINDVVSKNDNKDLKNK